MRRLPPAVLGLLGALAACSRKPEPQAAHPHYVVGAPYQSNGTWFYPRESFRYVATGLAVRLPDRQGLTADGEIFDPSAMTASHAVLQLPAIARVTDLENGRQVRVRINDRGPDSPGRLAGLSRRAADLLGLPEAGATQVRVEVESEPSQALRDQLGGGPAGVSAAPVAAVVAQDLPPPGAARAPAAAPRTVGTTGPSADVVPDRLPETATQGTPQPGQLWIDAGHFSDRRYAALREGRLAGLPVTIRREQHSRAAEFAVAVGPFGSVAAADAALDQARAAGVTDAMIVVE